MRVLIVGCGYVGLPLGTELVRQGHEVFLLRRTNTSGAELKSAGIFSLQADITPISELEHLPREFGWVVNCVSSSGGGLEAYRHVYMEGMQNLVRWLDAAGLASFVYTSSTSVYGQTDGSVVTEDSPTEPLSPTAQVLVETEQGLLAAAREKNFPGVILRVAGIYGPGRGYWFQQFLRGEAQITGKGERILNMIHRDDLVGCIIAALERGKPAEIYNAVDDEPVKQLDFFHWLAAELRRAIPPPPVEPPEQHKKRGATT